MAGRRQYPGVTPVTKNTFKLTITDGYAEVTDEQGNPVTDEQGKVKKQQKRYFKTVTAKSAKEASDLRAQWITEIKGGAVLTNNRMTLQEFYDYFKNHAEKLAPKTLLAYDGLFIRVKDALGHKKLNDITPNHIRTFVQNLSEEGIYAGRKKGQSTLSSATIQKHYKLLNLLFNRAIKWGLCSANPCKRTDTPKAASPHISVYDENTLSEFIAKIDTEETKYQALIFLALSTGIRRGELFALKWDSIDFDRNVIEIRHTLQYVPGEGLTLKDPKTELSSRKVSVPCSVMAILKSHKAEQAAKRLKLGGHINQEGRWEGAEESENDFVFCTWNGKAMHPDTLNNWLTKFTKANGLPHISPHSFRHMAASFLIKSGVDVRTVSGKLGHARTSTTTDIYAHVIQSAEQQTADIMAGILSDSKTKGKEILEKQKKQAE
ncbi:MAG: tyrosine-type recombinase/integrase [Sporomusaceae bacterium]|nr:tyrosine-type recombinase/integrase [Sporomusaceae bacterium]